MTDGSSQRKARKEAATILKTLAGKQRYPMLRNKLERAAEYTLEGLDDNQGPLFFVDSFVSYPPNHRNLHKTQVTRFGPN